MIRLDAVRRSYGSVVAVDGVSLEVRPGETFGLLGPNGAGKSTTLMLLAGFLRPDSGEIRIDGALDPTRSEVRSRLGIAPQSLSLYPQLSGEENLAFFGRLSGLGGERLRERVKWALDFAGLDSKGRDRVSTYSGGMQRRLNLACALVHDPPVLLLDEPTAGVDPQSRNRIFENIESLRDRGRTIVYTTHYIEEAERLCDRVAILDRGKLLALDTVDGLLAAHGGPSVVEAELARVPADDSRLPGTREGTRIRVESDRPLEEVAKLGGAGVPLVSLHVRRPDLESVFLSLTGRRLRD